MSEDDVELCGAFPSSHVQKVEFEQDGSILSGAPEFPKVNPEPGLPEPEPEPEPVLEPAARPGPEPEPEPEPHQGIDQAASNTTQAAAVADTAVLLDSAVLEPAPEVSVGRLDLGSSDAFDWGEPSAAPAADIVMI